MAIKEISLQKQLVKHSVLSSVLAGVLALVLLIVISSYQAMQIQDEIMDEISDMLLIPEVNGTSGMQVDQLSEEFDIQYQLLLQDLVLTSSHDYSLPEQLSFQYHQQQGYSLIWYNWQLWRRYVQYDAEGELKVFLVQPMSVRFAVMLESMALYFIILLLLWLLQWGIVHLLIKKQLAGIHRLSQQISNKTVQDLQPIEQQSPALQELQPMVLQLNKMLARVEQAFLSEQRFTADASHELRSPLSAIQLRLQVLKRQYADDEKLQQAMQQIQQDVQRGTQILENLLFLARLDPTDVAQLPKQTVNLKHLITEAIQIVMPLAEQKDIQWQVQLSEVSVQANAELLFSCLRNLLDNAIRYQQHNGTIYLSLQQIEHNIEICIEDDGTQLTDDVLVKMGERFYRALGTKTQGSGLGLSICKKIIELHQGEMFLDRSKFGGLKVRLNMPKIV